MIKSFFIEYLDDIIEYVFGCFFIKIGVINVIALFLEKYGLTFDYAYFGATGGFIWWMITKFEEQKLKEDGKLHKKVTIFRAFLFLFLSMIFSVFFTSIFHGIIPSLGLPVVAVGTGLFWEKVYVKLKSIFNLDIKDDSKTDSNFKNNTFNEEDSEHPKKPGG